MEFNISLLWAFLEYLALTQLTLHSFMNVSLIFCKLGSKGVILSFWWGFPVALYIVLYCPLYNHLILQYSWNFLLCKVHITNIVKFSRDLSFACVSPSHKCVINNWIFTNKKSTYFIYIFHFLKLIMLHPLTETNRL